MTEEASKLLALEKGESAALKDGKKMGILATSDNSFLHSRRLKDICENSFFCSFLLSLFRGFFVNLFWRADSKNRSRQSFYGSFAFRNFSS